MGGGFLRKAMLGAGSLPDPYWMDKIEWRDTVPGNEGITTENTPPADLVLGGTGLAIGRTSIPKYSIDLQDKIKSWEDKESETNTVRRMDTVGESKVNDVSNKTLIGVP